MGKKRKQRKQVKQQNAATVRLRDPGQSRIVYVPQRFGGMHVDHDQAMRFSAVFACVRYIAETISYLAWHHMRRATNNQANKERIANSQLERLLNVRSNPEMSGMSFRETLIAWALTWGNGYAEIVTDNANRPTELWPISPDRVQPDRDRDTGDLIYKITDSKGGATFLPQSKMFHLHGLGFDGRVGYSVISYAARSIGVGIAQDEYSSSFFGNNTQLAGVFEHPESLSEEAYTRLKDSFNEAHRGPANAYRPLFLEEGMKWKTVGVPPEDAQLIESKNFSVEEIARWFRVPPHKIGHLLRATFSNIEHQAIESVTDTLMPWISRLEQEANAKLLGQNDRVSYTKINVNSLLRGDLKSRSEFYNSMLDRGVFSINEVRELEDLNPITDGNLRLVPMNMQTLDAAANPPEFQQVVAPSQDDRSGGGDQDDFGQLDNVVRAFQQATTKALKREEHRVNDALRRYGDDRSGYQLWTDKFFAEHRNYLHDQMRLFLKPALLNDGIIHYENLIGNQIDYHLALSKKYTQAVYDDPDGYRALDSNSISHLTETFLKRLQAEDYGNNQNVVKIAHVRN